MFSETAVPTFILYGARRYEGVLSPTRKETSYSDFFNIFPMKLNTLLSPLL